MVDIVLVVVIYPVPVVQACNRAVSANPLKLRMAFRPVDLARLVLAQRFTLQRDPADGYLMLLGHAKQGATSMVPEFVRFT